MNSNKSKIYILMAAALILAVGFAVVRTVLMINYYDVEEGLYQRGAYGVTAARIMFAVSLAVLAVTAFLLIKKRSFKSMPEANHGVVFTGALCGFMCISSALLTAWYFIPSLAKSVFGTSGKSAVRTNNTVLFITLCLTILLSLASSLYYFWCASTETKLKKLNYRLLSLMPVLWGVVYLIYMYFRKDTVINSQERIIQQFSVITVMLYCLAEARFHFGISRFRMYVALTLVSVVSVIVAAVPSFILTAFWLMPFSPVTVFAVMQVALAAYMVCRLVSIGCGEEKSE